MYNNASAVSVNAMTVGFATGSNDSKKDFFKSKA
jgi:hypothetical protein